MNENGQGATCRAARHRSRYQFLAKLNTLMWNIGLKVSNNNTNDAYRSATYSKHKYTNCYNKFNLSLLVM